MFFTTRLARRITASKSVSTRSAESGELLGVPTQEEEPVEITSVQLEEYGLEAFDGAVLL
jgi:hypothetical protein